MTPSTSAAGATDLRSVPRPVPDDFAWQSLHGVLAPFTRGRDRAAVMVGDVGIFGALADHADPEAWAQLAEIAGPGGHVVLGPLLADPPPGWTEVLRLGGVQMAAGSDPGRRRDDVVDLGAEDLTELLELVARTRPGPFFARTADLGGYVGVRSPEGRLVAAAGRRLATADHVEVSAVCVDDDHRRQGLARVVVDAVVAAIRAEGRWPLLHAAADNTGAIALYEAMGFSITRRFDFVDVQAPGDGTAVGDGA